MKITEDVYFILNRLEKAGFEGYIVGGCVRDAIMGLEPHDYDITTNALPEEIKKIFKKTVDTGIKHGTVTVLVKKRGYEVTTYRIDGEYGDFRHPKSVEFTDDIIKDLSRRDFTMNAIAYNPTKGYKDPFGGRADINKNIIRGVREPKLRFSEDALRMLRCIRFSAQLGFEIEDNTYKAVKSLSHLIENVSTERITAELLKLVTSPHREKITLLNDTGLAEHMNPHLGYALRERSDEIGKLMAKLKPDKIIALAVIFGREPEAEKVLREFKLSNDIIKESMKLIKYYDLPCFGELPQMRRILSEIGKTAFLRLIDIKEARGAEPVDGAKAFIGREEPVTKKELDINGVDIMKLGFKGRDVGNIIDGLMELVFEYPEKNKKEILIEEAMKWQH